MDMTRHVLPPGARARDDLRLAPGETFLAGGTWLMSEPQPDTTGFVDLTTLGWPDLEVDRARACASARPARSRTSSPGRRAAASVACRAAWAAASVIPDAANALLASFKIWNTATVGGNVCRSFAAGAMVSLAAGARRHRRGLDARTAASARIAVADLMTGNGDERLRRGEVLRAVDLPEHALRSRALLRKIALAEHGRSGAVVTGRVDDDGGGVFTVTAATLRPVVFRFAAVPDAARSLAEVVDGRARLLHRPARLGRLAARRERRAGRADPRASSRDGGAA